jgi:electron transport complex protein RnfC
MAMGKDLVDCMPILNKVSAPAKTVLAIAKGQPIPDNFEQDLESVGVEVLRCPAGYPNGVNRNMVQLVTGKTTNQSSGDSRSAGAAIVDVCTTLRILKAVKDGYPAVETLIHVSAPAGQSDSYVCVREGILLEELLNLLPSTPSDMAKTIVGGPFTGHTQYELQVPITQGIDTVMFQSKAEISSYDNQPCMSCGYCVRYCPEGLLPNELSRYCEYDKFDAAEKNDLFHCTECGICSYVCPAKRSMVQLLRFGKHQLMEQRAEL